MTATVRFEGAARLPAPGDNVAIATRRLDAGAVIATGGAPITLAHTVMEGHRFVLEPIPRGAPLTSWGLAFGLAMRDLAPGEYVCNASILEVLAGRNIDFELPGAPAFRDHVERYVLDEASFRAGEQVTPASNPATFLGYPRGGGRGVGTRNFIVVLATTVKAAGFAAALAARFESGVAGIESIDGVVAITHTEGDGAAAPHNLDHVLRALSGFIVHSNVAAALVCDYGDGAYTNDDLERFMRERGAPLDATPHAFLRIETDVDRALDDGCAILARWVADASTARREPAPLAHLKVALQCGGSDAFSGVSGNALAGWVAKAILRNGGSANLAETDELIGAEPYVLSNVRDLDTARRFLDKIEAFKVYASRHGASAEGNPSGGNKYRGLYNIALKSIGAARKRDPEVRLDYVIDYGAPMDAPGYYFMDSPGNDLESIAGQVASGANLVFFITGNGSITNFPFVPTLKFVTTTGRFEMLADEMDVNAGRYNDGEPMDAVGAQTFDLALRVASGEPSKGELAGHAQVQLWRDWPRADGPRGASARETPAPDGAPLAIRPCPALELHLRAFPTGQGHTIDQVGLVMPTSLCSGQPARLIAERLDARAMHTGVTRYVSLVHTEGCGSANAEQIYLQTLLGHLRHRFVKRAVLLEHGCEKTHNDAVRHFLDAHGEGTQRYGFASVQLDGGLAGVSAKVIDWFEKNLAGDTLPEREAVGADALRLGVVTSGEVAQSTARVLCRLIGGVVAAGGTVVTPDHGALVKTASWRNELLASPGEHRATLAYGTPAGQAGLHVVEMPTRSAIEALTGLGGTGVEVVLAHIGDSPLPAHPLIALVQASGAAGVRERYARDLDVEFDASAGIDAAVEALAFRIVMTASGDYTPTATRRGITAFQLSRGPLGVSM